MRTSLLWLPTIALGTMLSMTPALQVCDMPMNGKNKYYNSTWRRNDAHCPGGFMMESSVHFLAALRMLAAAGGAYALYRRRNAASIARTHSSDACYLFAAHWTRCCW